MDLGKTTVALYIATLDGTDKEVVVKFITQYNEEARRILASAGFAPKLHFCAHVVGGLYMVVMDRVDGKSLWELRTDRTPIPTVVLEHVREAMSLLHKQNIVFGTLTSSTTRPIIVHLSLTLIGLGWMERADTQLRSITTTNGQRRLFHMVLCAKSMICGSSNG